MGAPQGVDLWVLRTDAVRDPALLRAYEALLSPDEATRLRALRLEPRRREYLLARALVRTVLSRYEPAPPSSWRFRTNAHGRPELDPLGARRFSLSHCEGLLVCAVADGRELGVDAEPEARAAAISKLAPRILSERERSAAAALPLGTARALRPLQIWILKEAYAKAIGTGLRFPLRSLSFSFQGERVSLAEAGRADPGAWSFTLLRIEPHWVALAVERAAEGAAEIQIRSTVPLADPEP